MKTSTAVLLVCAATVTTVVSVAAAPAASAATVVSWDGSPPNHRPTLLVAAAAAAQQPTEPARDQYLPIDKLPPSERMPSAPFVIAAYALVWVIAMYYLWSIWRRTGKLEDDMQALARRQRDASR
jgi:hypothetical protein